MKYFVIIFFILSSCQSPYLAFNNWVNGWKEIGLNQLASEGSEALDEGDRLALLVLFLDIDSSNCSKMKNLIENNTILVNFEREFNLGKGFLYDSLYQYNYGTAIFNSLASEEKQVAFLIVSAWKTKYSISQINSIIAKITQCYPY